jgi:hypothetical protein
MKKPIIILGIISLIAAGYFGVRAIKKAKAEKEWDNVVWYDDDANDNDHDDFDPGYQPENRVELNAALLALTKRQGMAPEYDSLCHAIAFASEVMDVSASPGLPFGYEFYHSEEHVSMFPERLKWGTGMKPLRLLLDYANGRRNSDMAGLDKLIRHYGRLIKLLVPYEKYVANGWEKRTAQLLTAYDDLSSQKVSFGKIYEMMEAADNSSNSKLHFPYAHYEKIAPFVSDRKMSAFINGNGFEDPAKRGEIMGVVWAYSFWGRRFHENPDNIPHLAATLKTLRDELYADAKPPAADKNRPPIEPYLASVIRPNEDIYPWKLYTDRVKFVLFDEFDDRYMIVEKDGEEIWLINHLSDDMMLNSGDVIDLTWYMETVSDGRDIEFSKQAHSVKAIKAGATTLFHQKYGGIPQIIYHDEEITGNATKAKMLDSLFGYLLESKNPKITEALKIFGINAERLQIDIYECDDWNGSPSGMIYGYGMILSLVGDDDRREVMGFIYNPDTGKFHIDADVSHG